MSQMLTALSDLFQQDLVPGIQVKYAEIDPVFKNVVASSETVVQDELSKGYKAIHTFATSLAGATRYGSPLGPQMATDVSTAEIISAHESYPGVSEIPLPGLANRYITVARLYGSVAMNLAMVRANKLNTTIGDYPSFVLEQTAYKMAHEAAVAYYLSDDAQAVTLDLTGAGAAVSVTGRVATLTKVTANTSIFGSGRARRVLPGLQYDIWLADATMSVCYTTRGWVMVDNQIDFSGQGTLTLLFQSATDAAAFYTAQGNDGGCDFDVALVPYSAIADRTSTGAGKSIMPCGYQSWMRTTGTLFGTSFGDLNVASYGSMFKSKVEAVSGELTEAGLNEHMARFEEATGVKLDTMITTNGVVVGLLDSYGADATSSIVRLNRNQGDPVKINLGMDEIAYSYNGRMFRILVSDFINSGELAILKTAGGNLIRYEPPKVDGTDASPGAAFDPRLEWLGPKVGSNTIWLPAIGPTGANTNGVIAPFDQLLQHAAREVRGIRLTTINEY